MQQQLTDKQKNLLEIIEEFVEKRGENPTGYGLQKYMEAQGIRDSLKSVMQVVEALEKKELIKRDGDHRVFVVKNNNYADLKNIFSIPLYGLASCGEALAYANDTAENYLQLSKSLFTKAEPKNLFAVKALGDSMDKLKINDGDYVIFEKCETPNQFILEGKIVVAVINGLATIKVFKKVEKDVIGLFPHSTNSVHQPIFIAKSDSILIAGVFKKVMPVKYVSL
jgi:SOS-response transcriptional repressor LexA